MTHEERLKEIKEKLAEMKPKLLQVKMWGKEHDAMEYMINRIEDLELRLRAASLVIKNLKGIK